MIDEMTPLEATPRKFVEKIRAELQEDAFRSNTRRTLETLRDYLLNLKAVHMLDTYEIRTEIDLGKVQAYDEISTWLGNIIARSKEGN